MELIREAVLRYVEAAEKGQTEVDDPANDGRTLASLTDPLPNPYQDMVARWRLDRTLRQMSDLAAYRLELDAWPADIYLLRVLTELHQRLGALDEFLVVTNLQFWHDATAPKDSSFLAPESGSLYLAAQEQAVVNRMRLYRVFLVDPTVRNQCGLRQHREFLERVTAKEPLLDVKVHFREFDDLDNAKLHLGHFAVIRRRKQPGTQLGQNDADGGCMVVEPVYYAAGKISHLRLLFSRGSGHEDANVKFYIDRFFNAAEGSKSIEVLADNHQQSGREVTAIP